MTALRLTSSIGLPLKQFPGIGTWNKEETSNLDRGTIHSLRSILQPTSITARIACADFYEQAVKDAYQVNSCLYIVRLQGRSTADRFIITFDYGYIEKFFGIDMRPCQGFEISPATYRVLGELRCPEYSADVEAMLPYSPRGKTSTPMVSPIVFSEATMLYPSFETLDPWSYAAKDIPKDIFWLNDTLLHHLNTLKCLGSTTGTDTDPDKDKRLLKSMLELPEYEYSSLTGIHTLHKLRACWVPDARYALYSTPFLPVAELGTNNPHETLAGHQQRHACRTRPDSLYGGLCMNICMDPAYEHIDRYVQMGYTTGQAFGHVAEMQHILTSPEKQLIAKTDPELVYIDSVACATLVEDGLHGEPLHCLESVTDCVGGTKGISIGAANLASAPVPLLLALDFQRTPASRVDRLLLESFTARTYTALPELAGHIDDSFKIFFNKQDTPRDTPTHGQHIEWLIPLDIRSMNMCQLPTDTLLPDKYKLDYLLLVCWCSGENADIHYSMVYAKQGNAMTIPGAKGRRKTLYPFNKWLRAYPPMHKYLWTSKYITTKGQAGLNMLNAIQLGNIFTN